MPSSSTANGQCQTLCPDLERLNQALAITNSGFYDWDVVTGIVYYSPQWVALLGYRAEDLGNHYQEWISRVHPDDKAQCKQVIANHLAGLTPEYRCQHRLKCQNGEWLWVLLRGQAIARDTAGHPTRVLGVHSAITERKQAEITLQRKQERLTTILEVMSQGIIMQDRAGVVHYSNQAARRILSATAAQLQGFMLHNQGWRVIKSDGNGFPDQEQPVYQAFHSGLAQVGVKMGINTLRNQLLWLEVDVKPLVNAQSHTVEAVVIAFNDITQQQQQAIALQQAELELAQHYQNLEHIVAQRTQDLHQATLDAERANRSKSDFLAIMSHEIRTPLNGILGILELLAPTPLNEDQRHLLTVARYSSLLLQHIINDILDFSKIEAKKLKLETVAFTPGLLVSEVVEMLSPVAEKKQLCITVDIDQNIPIVVAGDPMRIRQILFNLVSNAIKFTTSSPDKAGFVRVKLWANWNTDDQSCQLIFQVEDNGIGIAEQHLKTVCQPFIQAEESTTRRFGGTGLGLAICQHLVSLMAGQLEIVSVVDQGSTFKVTLHCPVLDATQLPVYHHSPYRPALHKPLSIAQAEAEDQLILLVDDNEVNQEVTQLQIRSLGYTADIASNGLQALAKWQAHRYALILTDCYMPEMDGFQLTQAIRQREADSHSSQRVPIIAITADVVNTDIKRCLELGMDSYLAKPLGFEALAEVLTRWLPLPPRQTPVMVPPTLPTLATTVSSPPVPPIDKAALSTLVGDNPTIHQQLLAKFVRLARKTQTLLHQAQATQQTADIRFQAHKLKSSAKAVGAYPLAEHCAALEAAAKQADWNTINQHLPGLDLQLEAIIQCVIQSNAKSTTGTKLPHPPTPSP